MEKGQKLIEEQLREQAQGSRISCSRARKVAEDLDVSYKKVGEVADRLKIKIENCELGCF